MSYIMYVSFICGGNWNTASGENHRPAQDTNTFAELYHIKLFSVHLNIKTKTTPYYRKVKSHNFETDIQFRLM